MAFKSQQIDIWEDMCCGRDKAMKLLAELDKKKVIGLVERIKQGQGRHGGTSPPILSAPAMVE